MHFASQRALDVPNQLQLIAQFLEDLSGKVESPDEGKLCRAVAEKYRVAANRLAEKLEITTPTSEEEPQTAPDEAA